MTGVYVAVDLDGTLTKSNVSFAFGRFLYAHGRISLIQTFLPAFLYLFHWLGLLSIERLHQLVFRALFLGKPRADIETDVAQFLDLHWSTLVRPSIQTELSQFVAQGAHVALLSSSPDFLVRQVAKRLGIEDVQATEYIVDEKGHFAAIGQLVNGFMKAQIVQKVKKIEALEIVAITDSILDKPLLEEADVVIAVAPDRKLARLARLRGWRVVNG